MLHNNEEMCNFLWLGESSLKKTNSIERFFFLKMSEKLAKWPLFHLLFLVSMIIIKQRFECDMANHIIHSFCQL